jgi:hypothetical protein
VCGRRYGMQDNKPKEPLNKSLLEISSSIL